MAKKKAKKKTPNKTGTKRGSKKAYTSKQKRQAADVTESEKNSGRSTEDAERIGWATVNKLSGGGKKSGSGRGKKTSKKKTAKKATRKKAAKKS